MATLDEVLCDALAALRPPPRLPLSESLEKNLVLPQGVSAQPGRVRLWAYQREIADAIGDSRVERVSIVKSARLGFTTLLTGAIGHFSANEPSSILTSRRNKRKKSSTKSIRKARAATPRKILR
jgi:phage terminase large subunit GpA-like protein